MLFSEVSRASLEVHWCIVVSGVQAFAVLGLRLNLDMGSLSQRTPAKEAPPRMSIPVPPEVYFLGFCV